MDSSTLRRCSQCRRHRPVTDFPWKPQRRHNNDQPPPPPERAKTCGPCKVRRDNRRRPRQDVEETAPPQIGQENDGPPPPKRARLESNSAAEAEDAEQPEEDAVESDAADTIDTSLLRRCSECRRHRPVTDFPWKPQRRSINNQPPLPPERAKTCGPCK
ncbi:hypothetical protein E4U52_008364, partial [Claviceps spartinae]